MTVRVWANVCVAAGVMVLASASVVSAQSSEPRVSFGVKAGLVRATVSSDDASFDPTAQNGFGAGVTLGIELGRGIRFQPEAIFSNQKFGQTEGNDTLTVKARFVDVPLLLATRGNVDGKAQPVFYAGPMLGFRSKVTQTLNTVTVDSTDEIEKVNVGFVLGAGVEIQSGRGALTFEGRVNLGVRNLSKDKTDSLKSRSFMLLAGYRF
jgi:hypothetical protein